MEEKAVLSLRCGLQDSMDEPFKPFSCTITAHTNAHRRKSNHTTFLRIDVCRGCRAMAASGGAAARAGW